MSPQPEYPLGHSIDMGAATFVRVPVNDRRIEAGHQTDLMAFRHPARSQPEPRFVAWAATVADRLGEVTDLTVLEYDAWRYDLKASAVDRTTIVRRCPLMMRSGDGGGSGWHAAYGVSLGENRKEEEGWPVIERVQDAFVTLLRLFAEQVDFTGKHWAKVLHEHQHDGLRVNGEHYVPGTDSGGRPRPGGQRGHGGHRFYWAKNDGTVGTNDDVWAQGKLPPVFRERYPDNARWITAEEYESQKGWTVTRGTTPAFEAYTGRSLGEQETPVMPAPTPPPMRPVTLPPENAVWARAVALDAYVDAERDSRPDYKAAKYAKASFLMAWAAELDLQRRRVDGSDPRL